MGRLIIGNHLIGRPKQPTLTVCTLVDDRYQKQIFRGNEPIVSTVFPVLTLTASQVLKAKRP